MAATIITTIGKSKTLRARAGIITLPRIIGMAFGDGAVRNDTVIVPSADDNILKHELIRKPVDGIEIIHDTRVRYICTLGKDELAYQAVNECGLYDADGDLVCIKSFPNQCKDDDMEMQFRIDDLY